MKSREKSAGVLLGAVKRLGWKEIFTAEKLPFFVFMFPWSSEGSGIVANSGVEGSADIEGGLQREGTLWTRLEVAAVPGSLASVWGCQDGRQVFCV